MRFSVALIASLFMSAVIFTSANAKELKSNVLVLLDFSNSYFTEDRIPNVIPDNIMQLSELIANKKDGPKRPSLIQILPINSVSEVSRPICEFRIQKKKLIGKKDTDCGSIDEAFCSAKTKLFLTHMEEECIERIKKNKEDNATDISGALALASQMGIAQTDESRYLIIFSDMYEYRHKELPVSKIDLSGFHVLVVCGGFFNTEKNAAKLCMDDQEGWRSRFESLGAMSVAYTIETAQWSNKIGKEFFEND